MIDEVVADRRMPPLPGIPDEQFGSFSNHVSLRDDEIDTILDWCRGGALEGDPALAPPPVQWASTGKIADPDVVLEMEKPCEIPADGTLPYRYIQIPTGFREDKWVTAAEVAPSNRSVVHHIIVHVTGPRKRQLFGLLAMARLYGLYGEKARFVAQYTAGDGYVRSPENFAMRIPAASTLTLEVHYQPNGLATQDRTKVALEFADGPPEHEIRSVIFAKRGFKIPARNPHFKMEVSWRFERPSLILSLRPHMHRRGKHWRYWLKYPDGSEATLLALPRWRYDWQLGGTFETPIKVPAGTEVFATACYDNSAHNLDNPDPNVDVTWGIQDADEMLVGAMKIVELPNEEGLGSASIPAEIAHQD